MEEDMEIYHIVDVPDTPDRSNAWNNDRKCVGNPEKRERAFPVADETSNSRNYITVTPSEKSYPAQNGPIFRRAQTEKVIGLGTTHSSGVQKMEKGKAISFKFPSKQSHHGRTSVLDLTEENGQFQQQKPVFLHRGSRDNAIEDKKELKASIGNSSLPLISDSSNTSRNAFTGKCKLDSKTLPGLNIIMDRGKGISLSNDSQAQSKTEKQVSLPPRHFTAPRGRGHKRLVRNGCISPQNIASRAKQSSEQSSLQTNYVEQSHAGHLASSNTMSPISAVDVVAEERDSGRVEGNGVLIHPSSRGINTGTIHSDNRQLEADEILARELQEQLYHDDFSEGREIGEHFAGELQPTENLLHTSIGSHDISHPATRAQQSSEQSSLQTNYVEQSHAGHSASSNTMSPISVDDIVAEERDSGRVKGKGVLIHPSSHGINAGNIHSDNSRVISYEEANGTSNVTRNSLENCEGQGGWRTTHNEKNAGQHLYDVNGHHSRRNCNVRFINRQNMNRMDRSDTGSSQNGKDVPCSSSDQTPQPASLIIPEVDNSTRPRPAADSLTKRQRKRELSSGNPNEASHNSEIIFLNSSGESSSSSRSRVMDPELVELLSTPRFTNRLSEDLDDNDNNSLDARARQLEADEILARELQEQLYNDEFFEGRGNDEHLAWELQHTEDLLHTSIDSHNISHPTLFPRANRQPRARPHQNPSNRRRNVPQVPFSNRMSQLRSRMTSRSSTPVISSRGRRPRFPLDMDLDMRLDILEALEDAVGDFNDMGMADDIFNAHRDFNEDDYEMLLALDEHNHQHTGASSNQINSLPQSTIQTDNFTEACAICLETPVQGEIIRHLPCLHKFHKDCIDPWLHRKTSCPVCKSSIT